jgi:hypothetical protein
LRMIFSSLVMSVVSSLRYSDVYTRRPHPRYPHLSDLI